MLTREEIYYYFETLTPEERFFRELYLHPEDIFAQNELNPKLRDKYEQWKSKYQYVPWMKKLNNEEGGSVQETMEWNKNHVAEIDMNDAKELENIFCDIKIVRHARYMTIGFHGHEFIEMSYVHSGSCQHVFQTEAGQQEVRLEKGDLVIIPPGIRHKVAMFNDGVMMNILVNTATFRNIFLQDLVGNAMMFEFFSKIIWEGNQKSPILIHTGEDLEIENTLVDLVIQYVEEHPYSRQICNHLLGVWLLHIMPYCMNEMELYGEGVQERKLVAAIIDYLQKNYLKASLESVVEEFHYSSTYINHYFKKYTGTTVLKQIQRLRIEKACELLRYSALGIEEIAERVGYQTTSYFIGQFKKQTGMTPLKYRKQMIRQEDGTMV